MWGLFDGYSDPESLSEHYQLGAGSDAEVPD
jgi:hypothetical protein